MEYAGSGRLCREDYETLGGVSGSIEAAVEAAFTDPGHEPAIRRTRVPANLVRDSFRGSRVSIRTRKSASGVSHAGKKFR